MLKFLFKVTFISLLLFGLSIYAKYLITGQSPNLDINKEKLPEIDISKISDSLSNKVSTVKDKVTPEAENKETYLYKWRDEKGVIHYTSEKPDVDIKNLESIKIDNQTNVVPAVSNNSDKNEPSEMQNNQSSVDMPSNIYSPDGIKQLFDQAKDVQNLVNEQFEQQESSFNNN